MAKEGGQTLEDENIHISYIGHDVYQRDVKPKTYFFQYAFGEKSSLSTERPMKPLFMLGTVLNVKSSSFPLPKNHTADYPLIS